MHSLLEVGGGWVVCGVLVEDSCGGDYIFLKTDAGAAKALLYKATIVPPGYGNSQGCLGL